MSRRLLHPIMVLRAPRRLQLVRWNSPVKTSASLHADCSAHIAAHIAAHTHRCAMLARHARPPTPTHAPSSLIFCAMASSARTRHPPSPTTPHLHVEIEHYTDNLAGLCVRFEGLTQVFFLAPPVPNFLEGKRARSASE